ncbi:response regulator transcription factor [Herbivorax sp. ANBcel31]|uniref:response regulator transcription factor n=1 Tax=Herbivorax sp. ANBcel31 TaxID=3069754 RepID=UPI0027AEF18E|nr:response regulator transcription factor [Herbivorax sp. ANBcel31]MDQ2087779.1 response regulator transcription factor [Herbivorax sp. ANBcel31]
MKTLIIDDDKLVLTSLNTILNADNDVQVCGTGQSGLEAIKLYNSLKPDVLLMDIRMGEMTGIEAAEIILKKDSGAKILFLTTFNDDEYIVKALKIGAKGYILKQNFDSIVPAVKTVFSGQRVYGDAIIDKIPSLLKDKPNAKPFELNQKELEIIQFVADGLSNKEISEKLFLSEGTIRNYISIILEKLNLRDRTQLAIFYYKNMI